VDISKQKDAELTALKYQKKLKMLALQLERTEEQERKRIATDLHDGVCQFLVSAKLQLSVLRSNADENGESDKIDNIQDVIESAYSQARTLTYDLSPPVLHELGLEMALGRYLSEMEKQFGLSTEFVEKGPDVDLSRDLRSMLYRVIRELLLNIIKHAKASKVDVRLIRQVGGVDITVTDDGVGFSLDELDIEKNKNSGFGLFNVQEKLSYINGKIDIKRGKTHGSEARVFVPLDTDSSVFRGGGNEYQDNAG